MERKLRPDPLCLLVCEAVSREQRQAPRAKPLLPGPLVARCASPYLPTGHIPSYRDHWRMLGETCSLAFRGCGGRKSESHLTYTNMLNLPWNKWNHPSTLKVTVLKSPRLNRTRNYPTSARDFFHKAVITLESNNFWVEPGTFCLRKLDVQLICGQLSLTAGPMPGTSSAGSPINSLESNQDKPVYC